MSRDTATMLLRLIDSRHTSRVYCYLSLPLSQLMIYHAAVTGRVSNINKNYTQLRKTAMKEVQRKQNNISYYNVCVSQYQNKNLVTFYDTIIFNMSLILNNIFICITNKRKLIGNLTKTLAINTPGCIIQSYQ